MRQHVFNLAGNRATVTLYDPENPDDWTVKIYRQGQYCQSFDGLSENQAIIDAQSILQHWKQLENQA